MRFLAVSLQMAELEKRLAELEIAVGSGSDKQVQGLLSRIHTFTNAILLYFIPHNITFVMLPSLCNHQQIKKKNN